MIFLFTMRSMSVMTIWKIAMAVLIGGQWSGSLRQFSILQVRGDDELEMPAYHASSGSVPRVWQHESIAFRSHNSHDWETVGF